MFIFKGRKSTTVKFMFKALHLLKANHGRTPMLILFEILEMYKIPFRVIPTKKSGKGHNRVHLIT